MRFVGLLDNVGNRLFIKIDSIDEIFAYEDRWRDKDGRHTSYILDITLDSGVVHTIEYDSIDKLNSNLEILTKI